MSSAISSITKAATRMDREPLDILCNSIHESYQTSLSKCNARFWIYDHPHCKKWDESYRPLPPNFIQLDGALKEFQLPLHVDFDLVLIESVFGHFQIMSPIAKRLHLPTIRLEHTSRMPWWDNQKMVDLKNLRGDINVFISSQSRDDWGFGADEARVVEHGLDLDIYKPDLSRERSGGLSVVNDFINRGNILGFDNWRAITKDLPTKILGKTPGLSEPAKNVEDLIAHYQEASIFVNTSVYSPIPMSVLEAAACECAIVSTATCAIPDIFTHGINAFLSNDPKELRFYYEMLLGKPDYARELGHNARELMLKRFNLGRFTSEWNELFVEAANIPYLGAI